MFWDNFYNLCVKKGIKPNPVAKELGISSASLTKWKNGTTPNSDALQKIAEYFDVSVDYLLGIRTTPRKKGVKIPVYGTVPAGVPTEAIQDIIDYEEIEEEMAKNGEYFALKIKGHSMEPKICDGDIVIIRQQPDADNGDIVIAIVNGNDATCKKLKKMDKDGIALIPLNHTYEPLFYSNREIEELPVRIIGKVVELRRTF